MQPGCLTNCDSRIQFIEMAEESASSSDIKRNNSTKSQLTPCGKKIISVARSCETPESVTFESCMARIKNYVQENPLKSLGIVVAGLAGLAGVGYGICQLHESYQSSSDLNLASRSKRDAAQDALQETTEIEVLHQASILSAVKDLNGTSTRTALTRIEFEDETCQQSLLSRILNSTDSSKALVENPNIVWSSSHSGRPVTSVKLNREQFSLALGHSVTDADCMLRMSAEPLMTRKIIARIRKNAVSRDIQQRLEAAQQQASGRGEQYCIEITGDKLGERRVECRERYISTLHNATETPATETPATDSQIDTSKACIGRIALIADGIRLESAASANVANTIRFNQTTPFNQTARADLSHISALSSHKGSFPMDEPVLIFPTEQTVAEIFTDSVVRRCPNIQVDDYRVAVGVEARNDSKVVASVLSAEYLTQALDHILQLPPQNKPEVAIVIEPDSMPIDYLPDTILAGDYIEKLSAAGTRVVTLDPYDSSWLSHAPFIEHAPDTSSVVAKPQDFSLPRTMTLREKILLGTEAVIAASAIIGASASVYACARAKQRRKKPIEKPALEQEMQPMFKALDACLDAKSSKEENPKYDYLQELIEKQNALKQEEN